MTTLVSPHFLLQTQSGQEHFDRLLRQRSREKRAEILDAISRHPDADEGLKRQARLYRELLDAGREESDDT